MSLNAARTLVDGNLELPALPQVVAKINALVEDPAVGAREIGAAVAEDGPIAAKVLKIANSACFGLRGKVVSTECASALLGVSAEDARATLDQGCDRWPQIEVGASPDLVRSSGVAFGLESPMPPQHEPDEPPAGAHERAPESGSERRPRSGPDLAPERLLEALRARHGASRYSARRRLPLVKRALRAPPELRARLLGVVEAALAWDAAEANRRRGETGRGAISRSELGERWLHALAPLIDRW